MKMKCDVEALSPAGQEDVPRISRVESRRLIVAPHMDITFPDTGMDRIDAGPDQSHRLAWAHEWEEMHLLNDLGCRWQPQAG